MSNMAEQITKREEILNLAKSYVCNDRENTYGTPENNFKLISNFWTTYVGVFISPKDVAMMMALLKIARIKSGKPLSDNFADLAGYAACGYEVTTKEPLKPVAG